MSADLQTPAAPAAEAPAPKPARKGKAKGKGKPAAAAKPSANGGLTGSEVKILSALAKKSQTRNQLRKSTGIQKGYSRILGASTKDDGGAAGADSLEGRGYVRSETHEGERSLLYVLTAKGRTALEKAKA